MYETDFTFLRHPGTTLQPEYQVIGNHTYTYVSFALHFTSHVTVYEMC